GKDSIIITRLAQKAFYPAKIPFPLIHIDTGHNFDETLTFRDELVKDLNANLIIGSVQDSIDNSRAEEEKGFDASRNLLQTVTLLDTLEKYKIDAAMGGARRDEEKARAKERFFSHRDEFGQWDPKNQRPELWNLFNGKKNPGEHFRIFPISNWTEMDVWQYIHLEKIKLPSLYFTHKRLCVKRNGTILAHSNYLNLRDSEKPEMIRIRFRTIGDMTCTGAVISEADSVEDIINEVSVSRQTERGTRSDDKRSETAMEDRKREGYF
ncbi:MAG: sulfate adenylyltransferase subunit CysD, partial [Ignavibacteria bacterium]